MVKERDTDKQKDCRRMAENIKPSLISSAVLFPSGLMFMDTGNIGTEDTLAVIILAIFLLILIPVLSWRFRQLERKRRELYSPDYYLSDNFEPKAVRSTPADFSSIEPKAEQFVSGNSGLNGQWSNSIMSFYEYKEWSHKMATAFAALFILSGVMLFFLAYFLLGGLGLGHFAAVPVFIVMGLGLVSIVFGLFIPSLAKKHLRDLRDNDGYVKVKVPLATKDLSTPGVVKKFLREKGYSYEFKEKDNPQRMEKKYVLDRGNYINLVFIRTKKDPPTYSGWLELGYKFSNYSF